MCRILSGRASRTSACWPRKAGLMQKHLKALYAGAASGPSLTIMDHLGVHHQRVILRGCGKQVMKHGSPRWKQKTQLAIITLPIRHSMERTRLRSCAKLHVKCVEGELRFFVHFSLAWIPVALTTLTSIEWRIANVMIASCVFCFHRGPRSHNKSDTQRTCFFLIACCWADHDFVAVYVNALWLILGSSWSEPYHTIPNPFWQS